MEKMEARYVGVDVSKDRLDVHGLPEGAAFAVARDGKGLAELVARLSALQPERIAVEATGGFETVVAAALAGASLPLVIVNPAQRPSISWGGATDWPGRGGPGERDEVADRRGTGRSGWRRPVP